MAAEFGSLRVEDAPAPALLRPRFPETPSVLDTTELRWFVPGALPSHVSSWFNASNRSPNERCDTYLLEGSSDVGVKRRFRETLELKVRASLDEHIELGSGLVGSLEAWRKWSPAEDLVEIGSDGQWTDVCKSIVKRRFAIDGTERALSPGVQPTGAGCDIEIAAVTVGDTEWWTFAFAAFGPVETRREALIASWQALTADAECPELFAPQTARAMGYPEWLTLTL